MGQSTNSESRDNLLSRYRGKAELLKGLAHPVRLCIVRNLIDRPCNVAHMQECLSLPQSTVSQHLSVLRLHRIIEGERVGHETYYRVISEEARAIALILVPDQ